ncbi:mpv17-like protein 2 [Brevipalpus obovatus]|uniref:mpv17-like protein 2 n=1 Tax=Brevipalpus obovatus TaxID=246614 RepID=UPI003D9EF6C5
MFKALRKIFGIAFSSRYLLVTNTTTGILSLSVADLMQQFLDHRQRKDNMEKTSPYKHDYRRSCSMIVGGIYFGVGGHFWYGFLDKRFPGKERSMILRKLIREMAFGPPYVSGCFLIVNSLENKTFKESWSNLMHNLKYILTTEWMFYLPLQWLNFYFLPPKYRYLFVASITLIYDNFLSYIFHRIPISI